MCGPSLLFGDPIILKGQWPPCSLDLTPPNFFLSSYIKDSASCNNPQNLNELKTSISSIITDISPIMLEAVSINLLHQVQLYMQHAGEDFHNFL
jgi:hypothetical protein